jgi:hypothetical protein
VQVRILRGSKVVATSPANLVEQPAPPPRDQVLLTVQDNGTRAVQQIDIAKRKVSLVFGDSQRANGQ